MKYILTLFLSLSLFITFDIFSKYNNQTIILNCIFRKLECSLSNLIEFLFFFSFLLGCTIFFVIYLKLYLSFHKIKKQLKMSNNKIELLKSYLNKIKKTNLN